LEANNNYNRGMIRSAAAAAVIAVAIFLSYRDLTSDKYGGGGGGQRVEAASQDEKEESFADIKNSVPQPRMMKSRMGGPTLKIFVLLFLRLSSRLRGV